MKTQSFTGEPRRFTFPGLVFLTALLILFLCGGAPASAQPIPGQYIAVFAEDVSNAGDAARELGNQFNVNVSYVYRHSIRGFAFSGAEQAAEALARNPRIAYVEPDQLVYTTSEAIDLIPTGVRRVGIDEDVLEGISPGGVPVDATIAIIDTGLDPGHPDLNIDPDGIRFYRTRIRGSFQVVSDDNWHDDHRHGTHVGGTAAANGQIVGVAPGALLTAVKVLGSGGGHTSVVIAGVDWVAENAERFDVANMSLGGGFSLALNEAVTEAVAQGVVFTVSAGNNAGDAGDRSPASAAGAITVSAMADFDGLPGGLSDETRESNSCDEPQVDDFFACFSNSGESVDVCAPGVNILSTVLDGGYEKLSGTSMAAPHVAGAAALYIAKNREALSELGGWEKVEQVTEAIKVSGWQFGDYGYFFGDPDLYPEPLLNVSSLLGYTPRADFAVDVVILSPPDSSEFVSGALIGFEAMAGEESEDGWADRTNDILWASSVDGFLGQGGSISANLSDGVHTVLASVTDYSTAFSAWDAVDVLVGDGGWPAEPNTLEIETWTDREVYVHGDTMFCDSIVTDGPGGEPVAGASMSFRMVDADGGIWTHSGETNDNGWYGVKWDVNANQGGLGTYYITVTGTKEDYEDGRGTTTFEVVDELESEPPGALEGVVTDADTGKGIGGATVMIGQTGPSTTTGGDGTYSIEDVEAGTYDVTVSATGYQPETLTATVNSDQTTTLNFALMAEDPDDPGEPDPGDPGHVDAITLQLTDNSNRQWARVVVEWSVSGTNLGEVRLDATFVNGGTDTETFAVSGSEAGGTHEFRERQGHGDVEVTLTVFDDESGEEIGKDSETENLTP